MIQPKAALRLVLDLTAGVLLLLCLAYYWLDNARHELAGTALFALLFIHNMLNRHRYRNLPRRQEARRYLDKVLVLCLLCAMAALLVTSVMISQTVFAAVSSAEAFTARSLHLFAAYWALVLVAVHLGIRWRVIVGIWRKTAGSQLPRLPPTALRLAAAGLSVAGIYSALQIGVADKLIARVSLDGWDFNGSTLAFFVHHLAFVGLLATVSHQVFERLQPGRRPAAR